jgi:hypothetical protein
MRVHNLYADADGESHFRDIEIELSEPMFGIGLVSKYPHFLLGRLVATRGALRAFAATGENPINFIVRHMNLDPDSLGAEDQVANLRAVLEVHAGVLGLRTAGRHSHLDHPRS